MDLNTNKGLRKILSGSQPVSEGGNGKVLGLIAGSGGLPFAVATGAKVGGFRLIVFALKGLADEGLADMADEYQPVEVGKLGKLITAIKKTGVQQVVLAGKVSKTLLYKMNVIPDVRAVKFLFSLKDRKDDTIMAAFLGELETEGVKVVETTAFTQSLLAPSGCLTSRTPTKGELKDIHFGAGVAREIGRLDIGQTVVVKHRAVMAIEAIEGTDEAIKRGGALAKSGAVVVKTAKPNQDLRFDVPVVGMDTLKSMQAAGASVLAIEAGRVIVVEREKVVSMADSIGISVMGFDD